MHPIAPPLPEGVNIIVMGEGLLVSSLGIVLASARCGWSHLIIWGLPIGTHCGGGHEVLCAAGFLSQFQTLYSQMCSWYMCVPTGAYYRVSQKSQG